MDDFEEMDESRLFGDLLHETESTEPHRDFARPIEDEDLFGAAPHEVLDNSDEPDELFPEVLDDDIGLSVNRCERLEINSGDEDLQVLETIEGANTDKENSEANKSNEHSSELDDIFLNDYESDPEVQNLTSTNRNTTKSYSNPVQLLSAAQIKKNLFNERLLQQAKAMTKTKPKLGSDFKHTRTISVTVDQDKLNSNEKSKFFFNKMFNASGKSNKSPPKSKMDQHQSELRRVICSQKRKVWDSFQQPVAMLDEEEEIFEAAPDSPCRAESEDIGDDLDDNDLNDDNDSIDDDNNMEKEMEENSDDNSNGPALVDEEDSSEDVNHEEADEGEVTLLSSSPDSSIHCGGDQGSIVLINSDESSNDSDDRPVRRNILDDDDDDEDHMEEGEDSSLRAEVDV